MSDNRPAPLAAALLAQFDENRREMPWRETSDPYAIWVSEVMLQQTRVETVVPYYRRWIERFPTVETLAGAPLDDVLREWEGLGYYSRARNLHSAARVVRERHAGEVPADPAALRELPGVGEYTAGAVASIAYGVAEPAVDGNVRRVLSRIYDLEAPSARQLRDLAAGLIPPDRPGDFNQALMEHGATICTPRSPGCPRCPVSDQCLARSRGVQEQRPLPKRRKAIREEMVETAVVARGDGALLLVRRPENGLLAGMWEFPGDDPAAPLTAPVAAVVAAADPVGQLEPVVHTFSHKRVTYQPTLYASAAGAGGAVRTQGGGGARQAEAERQTAWVQPHRLRDYALPVAQRKIARLALDEGRP